MGKVDDMRRLREAQHQQRQAPARATPAASAPGVAASAPAAATSAPAATASAAADDEDLDPPALDLEADSGSCSVCGKVKAMNRGVVVDHQKGLGKRCPGSRKPPA